MSFSFTSKRKNLGNYAIFQNLIFLHPLPLAPRLTKANRGAHPCAPLYKSTPAISYVHRREDSFIFVKQACIIRMLADAYGRYSYSA
jgi:hypothetical protein